MCTTMIITKGASIDGSMFVTHSDDDELGDQRLIYVPAQDHPEGATRKVFAEHYRYPRIVTNDRGEGYNTPGYDETNPIGFIPQVSHTYGYYDGNYGIMNEHNLMMGECTNAANFQPDPITEEAADATGKHMRLFYSQELSRIALERCKKAREAIILMGSLIDEYGYYSTGETLLIADKDEAWVFEMCALPHEKYHSAWVAQKVPDGEIFVAANEFRIREIITDNPDCFMYSRLLMPGVKELMWWKPEDGPLDWLKTVSPGEYNHPYYSLRRVWRILDRVNPDYCFSPWVKDSYTKDYPFSVEPLKKLSLRDIFSLYRDHYEGTEFDLTQGVAAGPYNDPNRFVGPYDGNQNNITNDKKYYGAWERAISIFYQGYTYVNQLRPGKPEATRGLIWFGPDVAYTTCFAPFSTKSPIPSAYMTGSPQELDRESAWWAFDFVANWARLNYKRMTKVDILSRQEKYELAEIDLVEEWDAECQEMSDSEAVAYITEECAKNSSELLKKWWELADMLVAKYSDGYCNTKEQLAAKDIGYGATWLSYTNYKDGPTTYDMKP